MHVTKPYSTTNTTHGVCLFSSYVQTPACNWYQHEAKNPKSSRCTNTTGTTGSHLKERFPCAINVYFTSRFSHPSLFQDSLQHAMERFSEREDFAVVLQSKPIILGPTMDSVRREHYRKQPDSALRLSSMLCCMLPQRDNCMSYVTSALLFSFSIGRIQLWKLEPTSTPATGKHGSLRHV